MTFVTLFFQFFWFARVTTAIITWLKLDQVKIPSLESKEATDIKIIEIGQD
jgi:hypothetical protein